MTRAERALVALLFAAALLSVALTANQYGITYDEQHYMSAGAAYAGWWGRVLSGDLGALGPGQVDEVWRLNHEHPPLEKTAAGAAYRLFSGILPGLAAYRISGAFWFALTICALYCFTRRLWGRAGALFASLSFASLPRVFAHAHFAALDMPVTAWFFITIALLAEALRRERFRLAALGGVSFGLALLAKINAVFIPFVIAPYGLIWWRCRWRQWLLPLLAIGPAVFYAGWPWLWYHPFSRLREYLGFHAGHAAYNVWYLGRLYQYAPWHYPFVVTAVTVPLLVLALALLGAAVSLPRRGRRPERVLLLLGLLACLLPSALPHSPKYNGARLFLPAFPFLAALAGGGFASLRARLTAALGRKQPLERRSTLLVGVLLGALALMPGVRGLVLLHPYQLAYYNALVGGARGAAERGFETIYWGQVLEEAPAFLDTVARETPTVLVIPKGAISLLTMQQQAGALDPRVRFIGDERQAAEADYVLFQAMQSDYTPLCWALVKGERPRWTFSVEGTPLLYVYDRAAVLAVLPALRSLGEDG